MELEGCVPGVEDQGVTQSCVGQAIATAVDARLRKLGYWSAPRMSRRAAYDWARILGKENAEDVLLDDGCMPRLAMKGIRKYGLPSAERWPLDPEQINEVPPLDVLMAASAARLDRWWRIDSSGRERVEDVCQALESGYPVIFGREMDGRSMDHTGPLPLGPHDPTDARGGHMMCLVGYTTEAGHRRFRGVNSWGTSWGDRGFFWASETFLMDPSVWDLYVLQVSEGG